MKLVAALLAILALGVVAAAGGALGMGSLTGPLPAGPAIPRPSRAALAAIPAPYLHLYQGAARTCPGLPWTVLAGIGTVESGNGRSLSPGVRWGSNPAGAEGPMQFEPATFALYARPVPPGGRLPPSPYDPADAIYAAARDLCANGGGKAAGLRQAVYAYNHADWYVAEVLAYASSYSASAPTGPGAAGRGGVPGAGPGGPAGWAPSPAATTALRYALAQVGKPYRWGGEGPTGFDCSGLTQAAYRTAGVSLPRTAQAQFAAGPHLPRGAPLRPGDLVFFGSFTAGVQHVGLVVHPSGVMVDAPHPGAVVRREWFPPRPGAPWGGEVYLGATDPAPARPGLVHLAGSRSR